MKGEWVDRSTVAGVGLVARLCCRSAGMFPAWPVQPTRHLAGLSAIHRNGWSSTSRRPTALMYVW